MNKNLAKCNTSMVIGNSVDIDLSKICDAEIRADITVNRINVRRIWGQIKDCSGKPMGSIMVKLIRVISRCGKVDYEGVAHTITDCEGFYQFDVCADDKSCYKVLVGKAVSGGETVIQNDGGNCNPCGCSCKHKYGPPMTQDETVDPCISCDYNCYSNSYNPGYNTLPKSQCNYYNDKSYCDCCDCLHQHHEEYLNKHSNYTSYNSY